MNESTRILVVDDEESIRGIVNETLSSLDYEVVEASSAEKALTLLQDSSFDLVISDIRMGGLSGLHLLKSIKGLELGPEVIIMTSFGSMTSSVEALREGASDYILKPFEDLEVISTSVRRALKKRKLSTKNERLAQGPPVTNEQPKNDVERRAQTLVGEKVGRDFIERIFLTSTTTNPTQDLLFEAKKLFNMERAGLWIIDKEKAHFRPMGNIGLQPDEMVPIPFPVSLNPNSGFEVRNWIEKKGHLPYMDEIKKLWGSPTAYNQPIEIGNEIQGLLVWTGDPLEENSAKSSQETFFLVAALILKNLAKGSKLPPKEEIKKDKPSPGNSIKISDPLTPFYHFDFFHELLNLEITRSRHHNHVISVSMIIFNHPSVKEESKEFKRFLHEISVQISTRIRVTDFATREGNKFFLVLPETGETGAGKLTVHLNQTISAYREQHTSEPLQGNFIWNIVSLEFPRDSSTIEGLIAGLETLGHRKTQTT